MRVRIDILAAKLGCAPTQSAVRASLAARDGEAEHDAFMAERFPKVRAAMDANAQRAKAQEFDRRAREDPMGIPGTPPTVRISPASASATTVVTPLPGLGRVRSPGRSIFGHN
jgi:hypothetical protein